MKRIHRNIKLLHTICSCKKNTRNSVIQSANRDFINTICELADNLLQDKIPLSEEDYANLYKYRTVLRKLVQKSDLTSKKKLIIQKGGFLEFLIPAAVTAIGELISNLVKNE